MTIRPFLGNAGGKNCQKFTQNVIFTYIFQLWAGFFAKTEFVYDFWNFFLLCKILLHATNFQRFKISLFVNLVLWCK